MARWRGKHGGGWASVVARRRVEQQKGCGRACRGLACHGDALCALPVVTLPVPVLAVAVLPVAAAVKQARQRGEHGDGGKSAAATVPAEMLLRQVWRPNSRRRGAEVAALLAVASLAVATLVVAVLTASKWPRRETTAPVGKDVLVLKLVKKRDGGAAR